MGRRNIINKIWEIYDGMEEIWGKLIGVNEVVIDLVSVRSLAT